MKKLLVLVILVLLTLTSSSQDKTNVLIMIGDMNDCVGAFGGNPQAIAPNIIALAQKKLMFSPLV